MRFLCSNTAIVYRLSPSYSNMGLMGLGHVGWVWIGSAKIKKKTAYTENLIEVVFPL